VCVCVCVCVSEIRPVGLMRMDRWTRIIQSFFFLIYTFYGENVYGSLVALFRSNDRVICESTDLNNDSDRERYRKGAVDPQGGSREEGEERGGGSGERNDGKNRKRYLDVR